MKLLGVDLFAGAGAGGASSAYHLAKFATAADIPINITVFERNSYIGGRSTTVNAYNDSSIPVELGASIFVEVNSILVDAVKEFNLSTTPLIPETPVPGAALAIWDGEELVLTQEGTNIWFDNAKLLWKYGLVPIKTMRLVKSVIGKFLKMYDEPAFPFESLSQVAQDVGLLAVTSATGEQYLEENSITGPFVRDVVQAATRVNYAQNMKYIHALEAMVSMAADDAQSVTGGNWQIFDSMIAASNATSLLGMEVTAIEKRHSGHYRLRIHNASDVHHDSSSIHNFDAVILAAPHQFSDIALTGSPPADVPDKVPYVRLHVTLFTSPHLLSPLYFNMKKDKPAPRVILTTLPKSEQPKKGSERVGSPGFFSISLLNPVKNPKTGKLEYLYKIFTPSPPNSTFLSSLLGLPPPDYYGDGMSDKDITWMYRKVWHSYPYEYPRVTFENIQLDDNLWYTSGMDSFISTMETNALMGKNVARLIVEKWRRQSEFAERQGEMLQPSMSSDASAV